MAQLETHDSTHLGVSCEKALKYVPWIAQVVAALLLLPSAGAASGALRGGAGPAADHRPPVLGAAVAQRQAEPGQQEEQGHLHLKLT